MERLAIAADEVVAATLEQPAIAADAVVAAIVAAADNTPVDIQGAPAAEENAQAVVVPQSRTCPAGHTLKYDRAPAGTCDGCLGKVKQGSLVSDCRECNWYLCTICTPIIKCPSGHALVAQAVIAGKCDGCSKSVAQGTLVMNCQECNWYLCKKCQALTQCPTGHELKPWASQTSGKCDLCSKPTKQGELVADCRDCNWFICAACHPQLTAPEKLDVERGAAMPLPKCPQGHDVLPALAGANCACDKCSAKIRHGSLASNCSLCNWALCAECHPIRQCKQGHRLEARQAVAGKCDGCGKKVLENQSVMDCRRCNWYICGSCHMSPARTGA